MSEILAIRFNSCIFSSISVILLAELAKKQIRRANRLKEVPTLQIKLINIGFGNIVSANRIIAIVSPESAPIKRVITEARDRGMLIDATYGRRTRAVIIADSGHVVLSAVQPETVKHRLHTKETAPVEDEE